MFTRLEAPITRSPKALMYGPAGSGKSTLAATKARDYATKSHGAVYYIDMESGAGCAVNAGDYYVVAQTPDEVDDAVNAAAAANDCQSLVIDGCTTYYAMLLLAGDGTGELWRARIERLCQRLVGAPIAVYLCQRAKEKRDGYKVTGWTVDGPDIWGYYMDYMILTHYRSGSGFTVTKARK